MRSAVADRGRLGLEKGHRIAAHVTSSNSPRFDVNPNTGELPGRGVATRIARNTIYFDATRPSALRLPVIYLEAHCGAPPPY